MLYRLSSLSSFLRPSYAVESCTRILHLFSLLDNHSHDEPLKPPRLIMPERRLPFLSHITSFSARVEAFFSSQHSSIFFNFAICWLKPNELCCTDQCIYRSQFLSPNETTRTIQKLRLRKHKMHSQHAARSTFHYSPAHLNAECWAQQNSRGSPVQSRSNCYAGSEWMGRPLRRV